MENNKKKADRKELEQKYEKYREAVALPKHLRKFAVTPHPIKEMLEEHGIAVGFVANYLGLSYPYVCNLLNGHMRVSSVNEKKLQELIKALEQQEEVEQ